MNAPNYEIFAIKYATRAANRSMHFIGGDPHDGPMPVDYYLWVVRNSERVFVVDTGFTEEMAAKRKRTYIRRPSDGLSLLGIQASQVQDVIITHLHYDHVGTFSDFPAAKFHLQDDEMAYATGRNMSHKHLRHSYEADEVAGMVRLVYKDRVQFHNGSADLAPGISVHRIGGHTNGVQCVRVSSERGWVVLASDSGHFYEHIETAQPFPNAFHLGEMLEGYKTLRRLADSPKHIIPGHDPQVLKRYPAVSKELEGIVAKLHVMPAE